MKNNEMILNGAIELNDDELLDVTGGSWLEVLAHVGCVVGGIALCATGIGAGAGLGLIAVESIGAAGVVSAGFGSVIGAGVYSAVAGGSDEN